jgi:serine protease AprX
VAAPHVSGALALLLSADAGVPAGSQESALLSGAVDLGAVGPDDTFGAGRLDVLAGLGVLNAMPGFQVTVSPADVVVSSGGSADIGVSPVGLNGFSGPVDLAMAGLPATVGAALLSATTVQTGESSTLHIDVSADAPSGTYPITVSGVSGTAIHRTVLELTVPPRDFALTTAPSVRTVAAGGSRRFTVGIDSLEGFAGVVRLRRSGVPPDATATWTRKKVSGTRRSRLIVQTSTVTPAGTYTLVIRGRSGSVCHRTKVTLIVS